MIRSRVSPLAAFGVALTLASMALASMALAAPPTPRQFGVPDLGRGDFNRLAAKADLGIFWARDETNPGRVDPEELVGLGDGKALARYVRGGALTKAYAVAYGSLLDMRRREAVSRELDQGRPTLVLTDLSKAPPEDRAVMKHLQAAASLIGDLYAKQGGAAGLDRKIPRSDPMSRALFERNQGPWCQAPETQADPFCNALASFPPRRPFAWPDDVTVDAAFCEQIGKAPNAKALMDPFTVVRRDGAGFKALPYLAAYGKEMKAVARHLRAAAAALTSGDEAAFKAYLLAAAQGFETNVWWAADEAWSKMSAENSRWYLRIGPDETYFDPCQVKAGFHVSLARIDKGALEWKRKLTPIRQELEERLAKVIGSAYTARQVKFKVPDFINIVLNAGDSRSAIGATVGQSLPNFGPVAAESRGRTVVMANLYTDPDSKADGKKKAELLLSKTTLEYYDETSRSHLLDVVLHEATHNFGPYGSTKVGGKLPEEVFGGRMDAILEELKAQTGSLYLPLVLQEKGLITAKEARQLWVSAILWAFGQVSQGLVTSTGKPRTYPQLAAVQLGELTRAGALTFDAGAGPDSGRFTLVWDKVPAAVTALMKEVGRIKASGDVEAAKTLVGAHTSTEGVGRIQLDLITERVRRFSKASFVYAVVP